MAQVQQTTTCCPSTTGCCEPNVQKLEPIVASPAAPSRTCCSRNHAHHQNPEDPAASSNNIGENNVVVNGAAKLPEKGAEKARKDSLKGQRNKEDRSIENIVKALHSLKTPEEKLAALCKKYTDLMEEHRTAQLTCKQHERRALQVTKEKEQLQSDYSKSVLARSRLESLCRELQRQCKVVKDESILRVKEEEEKRKDVSAKFQTTLTEISTLMTDNNQKNSVLREENLELSTKLKNLVEQYEMREKHVDKLLKHKELEMQLSEAKLAKSNIVLSEDKEKHLREKQKMLLDLTEYQRKCAEMATNEVQLRAQLGMYTEKYSEFQDTLTKSNQVFTSFKGEMEKMSKKIKKLEKETGAWKTRWENSNRALLEMAEDKQKHNLEIASGQKKIAQLEKLCRALQGERTSLLQQLGAMGAKPPPPTSGCAATVETPPDEPMIGATCPEAKPEVVTATTPLAPPVNSETVVPSTAPIVPDTSTLDVAPEQPEQPPTHDNEMVPEE